MTEWASLGNLWRGVMAAIAAAFFGAAAVSWWQRSSAGMWRELDRRERAERERVR